MLPISILLMTSLAIGAVQANTLFDLNQQNSVDFVCPVTEMDWLSVKENVALALTSNTDLQSIRIENCLKELEKLLKDSKKLQACFSELLKFNNELKNTPSSIDSYVGKAIDYYENAAPHVEVPTELQNEVFLKALDTGDVASAETYLKRQNIIRIFKGLGKLDYVDLPMAQVPSIDATGGRRFVIYDPGKRPKLPYTEKWVSFTVGGKSKAPTQLSVVATHWNAKGVAETYFADHKRIKNKESIHVESAMESVKKDPRPQVPNCYECHSNGGPITLHSSIPVAEKYADTLKSMNDRMAEIPMGFSKEFSQKRLKIGREGIDVNSLPDSFILSCFKNSPKKGENASINRVRNALNCHSCHDGESRSKLPTKYLEEIFAHRFLGGTMPPSNDLTPEERVALSACVNRYLSQIGREKSSLPGMLFYQLFDPKCDIASNGESRKPKEKKSH